MGDEIFSNSIRIKQFLGLNQQVTDTSIDIRESAGLQNVNITQESLDQRLGSTASNSVAFKDKTDTTTKNITGIYEATLGNTVYQVATGGDAFKQFTAGNFTDKTGSVTITDDDDIHFTFATFIDGSAADVIIAANGNNPPIKWTGSGNASALATPPGNFHHPVVHKNKLWVVVGDIVYFSGLRNGESWDTINDLVRFDHNGENISAIIAYADRIVVFQETQISMISGSSNRDLFVQTIVVADGTEAGHSVKEVQSRRYGSILCFLSKQDNTLKGFNGSKNLLKLGEKAKPLFNSMNISRYPQAVSANYKELGQYWVATSFGSGSTNDQVILYDYLNDAHTDPQGNALSTILYHIGIDINAFGNFVSSGTELLKTGDYSGFMYQQDSGLTDKGSDAIVSSWLTGRIDFGDPYAIKMLTDLSLVTTQTSATTMSMNVSSNSTAGTSALSISAAGGLWGSMIWGTGLWSGDDTPYTRAEVTRNPQTEEGPIIGRYLQFQANHSDSGEAMSIEEINIGVANLGKQPEYVES